MATYLPSITDYIPQIQHFEPDFNFFANVQQTKQSKYDTNKKQLSQLYGSLLNSPMSRNSNLAKREQFFKDIDGDIKRMAGMDLSLQQNVNISEDIFKQIYDDKHILKDMVWTKNFQNELGKAEGLRNCIDPDKCGGQYWDGGIEVMNLKRQEFMNVSDDEALSYQDVRFNPSIDIMGKATKDIKEAGFKISLDSKSGGYIVTTKNGKDMIAPLNDYLLSKYGNDAKVQAFYKDKGFLQKKQYISANAARFGSEELAELDYVQRVFNSSVKDFTKGKEEVVEKKQLAGAIQEGMHKELTNEGVSEYDALDWLSNWKQVGDDINVLSSSEKVYDDAYNKIGNIVINAKNLKAVSDRADELYGTSLLNQDLYEVAKSYSDLTTEQSIKADPYSLASYQSSLSLRNAKELKEIDRINNLEKMDVAFRHKSKLLNQELGYDDNNKSPIANGKVNTNITDAVTGSKGNAYATQANIETHNKYAKNVGSTSEGYIKSVISSLNKSYNDDQTSSNDKTMMRYLLKDIIKATGDVNAINILLGSDDVAKTKLFDKLDNLDDVDKHRLFETLNKSLDPSVKSPFNIAARSFSKDIWKTLRKDRDNVKFQKEIYDTYRKEYTEKNQEVVESIKGQLKDSNTTKTNKGYVNGELDASLVDAIQGASKSDMLMFVAADESEPRMQQAFKIFAEQNKDKFSPIMSSDTYIANDMVYNVTPTINKTPYEQAYEYAKNNWSKVQSKYLETYSNKVGTNTRYKGFLQGSDANSTNGVDYHINALAINRPEIALAKDFFKDIKNPSNIEGIYLGNGIGQESGISEDGQKLITKIMEDFNSNDKNLRKMVNGTMTPQAIAKSNEDLMAVTFNMDETYLRKAIKEVYQYKANDDEIEAKLATLRNGIKVVMKKEGLENEWIKNTIQTPEDYLLNRQGGNIKIDDFKNTAGQFTITSDNKGSYYISGESLYYKDGKLSKETMPLTPIYAGDGINGASLREMAYNRLEQLNNINEEIASRLKQHKSIADLEKLYKKVSFGQ